MWRNSSPGVPDGSLEGGFTYLGLMILVAILALATSATLTLGSIVQRREAEQRLLEVGAAYRQAIASYLNSSPAGIRSYPPSLAALLKDPRYPGVRRHLRQLYPDPLTGKAEWGIVQAPGGGIMGIHSLSNARPIKVAEFEAENQLFENKVRYAEWVFVVYPAGPGIAPGSSRPGQGANLSAAIPGAPPAQPISLFPAQNPAGVAAEGSASTTSPGGITH